MLINLAGEMIVAPNPLEIRLQVCLLQWQPATVGFHAMTPRMCTASAHCLAQQCHSMQSQHLVQTIASCIPSSRTSRFYAWRCDLPGAWHQLHVASLACRAATSWWRPCAGSVSCAQPVGCVLQGGRTISHHLLAAYRQALLAACSMQFTVRGTEAGRQGMIAMRNNPGLRKDLERDKCACPAGCWTSDRDCALAHIQSC